MYIIHSKFNIVSSVVIVLCVWVIVVVRCTRDVGCADPSTLSSMLIWGWLDTFSAMLLVVALLINLVVVLMSFSPEESSRALPRAILFTHIVGWLAAAFTALFTLRYNETMHLINAGIMFVFLNVEVWLVMFWRVGKPYHRAQIAYVFVTTSFMALFLLTGTGWFEIMNISLLVLASNWLSLDHEEILEFHTEEIVTSKTGLTAPPSVARPVSA